jgi:hypothetical protein
VLVYRRINFILYFLFCNFYGSFDVLLRYLIVFSVNFFATNYIILSPQKPLVLPEILICLGAVLYSCFVFLFYFLTRYINLLENEAIHILDLLLVNHFLGIQEL